MANESSVLVRLRLLGASTFARDANVAGRGLGTLSAKAQQAKVKLGGVGAAARGAQRSIGLMGTAVGVGGAAGFAKGVGASVNFEQSMANVQARLLTTKGNMELLSAQAIDLGGKTAFSANQAAQAMDEFAAAGFGVRDIMRIMPGTLNLAAASGTDLAFAAETTGALIRQFGLKSRDAGHVADLLTVAVNKSAIGMDDLALSMKYVGPVAGRFNQSIEDIGAATAILGNVGIKGETAGTTLRRALVNIVRPSIKTMKVLDGVGITSSEFAKATVNAKGELRGMPQILGNLAGQLKDVSAPDRRRALAQLFGVEALPGMITLMGMGERKIEGMSSSLVKSGGAAKRTAGIMRGTVKGAWDQFTGSLESASIKLTKGLMPGLQKGLRGAANLVTEATGPGAAGFMQGLEGGPQAPLSGMAGIAQKVGGVVGKLGRGAAKAGKQLIDAFKPAMPFFQNVLLPLLKGVAMGVIGGVVLAFKLAVPIIKVLATALGWVGTKLAPLKGVFQGVGMVIGFLLGGPILKLLGQIPKLGIVFRVLAVPIRFVGAAFKAMIGIVGKVASIFGRAWTAVGRFIGTFVSAPAKIARAAFNIVTSVGRTIGQLPGKALAVGSRFVSAIANGVRSKLGALGEFFTRVGKSIVDAIVKAIKGAPGAIASAISSVIPDKLKGAAKKILPGIATGGHILRGGMAVVGERGPELVNLPSRATVYSNRVSQRAGAALLGGAQFVGQLVVNLSGKQIHSEVVRFDRQLAESS